MVTCVSLFLIHQMDIFIFSVGHSVRHSNIFCRTFMKNVRLSDRSDEFRQHCFNITQVYSFWQDLSVDTKIFDFVSLTLTFDLLLMKLNLGNNFWAKRDMAVILHISIPCDKTFLLETKFFTLWSWPWLLTFFWKKLNLDHIFWTKSDRALILHVFIPCDKTFLLIPIFLT